MSYETKWYDFTQCYDLGLKVDGRIFWVNRQLLANYSPVFMAMLYGEFQETKQSIVDLPGKKPTEILELLRCLFFVDGNVKEVTEENVEIVLKLADEYQISDLLMKCYAVIEVMARSSSSSGVQKVMMVLRLALQYKLKAAVHAATRSCSVFSIGELRPYFPVLPEEIQHTLFLLIAGVQKPNHKPVPRLNLLCTYKKHVKRSFSTWNRGYQCEYCKHAVCSNCKSNMNLSEFSSFFDGYCTTCASCLKEIGNTKFVCECIDRLIIAQLEKIGM